MFLLSLFFEVVIFPFTQELPDIFRRFSDNELFSLFSSIISNFTAFVVYKISPLWKFLIFCDIWLIFVNVFMSKMYCLSGYKIQCIYFGFTLMTILFIPLIFCQIYRAFAETYIYNLIFIVCFCVYFNLMYTLPHKLDWCAFYA